MLMMRVLQGMQDHLLIYVDDCCIFSSDWSSHITHLQFVFERFREHNLRLHFKKCFFALPQIRYLGHIISHNGTQPDDEKLRLIQNYPSPKTQKQLRSAMGLFNYYRKFVKGYAIYLSQYSFDVEYVPGKTLGNAGALSKMPFHELPEAQAELNFEVSDEIVVAPVVSANVHQQEVSMLPSATQDRHVICLAPKKSNEDMICNVVLAAEPITNIAELQRECPDFKDMMHYLVTDELPDNEVQARKIALSADQFCLENGVLYH